MTDEEKKKQNQGEATTPSTNSGATAAPAVTPQPNTTTTTTTKTTTYTKEGQKVASGNKTAVNGGVPQGGNNANGTVAYQPEPIPKPTLEGLGIEMADEGYTPTYDNAALFRSQNTNPQRTPEQDAAYEKKRRNIALISAIADGLSALGNVYTTSRGADNIDGAGILSAVQQAKYDKLKAMYDKDVLAYQNAYAKAKALDDALNQAARERADKNKAANNAIRLKLAELGITVDKINSGQLEDWQEAILKAMTQKETTQTKVQGQKEVAGIRAANKGGSGGGSNMSNGYFDVDGNYIDSENGKKFTPSSRDKAVEDHAAKLGISTTYKTWDGKEHKKTTNQLQSEIRQKGIEKRRRNKPDLF